MYTTLVAFWPLLAGFLGQQPATSPAGPASLNYEFYKTKVQPIFLAKRPGRARCVACHSRAGNNTAFRLQPLSPGSTTWSEEESRKNFESTKVLVVPGNVERSRLLIHPLPEEGETTLRLISQSVENFPGPKTKTSTTANKKRNSSAVKNLSGLLKIIFTLSKSAVR